MLERTDECGRGPVGGLQQELGEKVAGRRGDCHGVETELMRHASRARIRGGHLDDVLAFQGLDNRCAVLDHVLGAHATDF